MSSQKAQDVMNRNVLVVEDTMPASDLATFFAENEISGAPVVAADGRVVGVVSLSDLARGVTESGAAAPEHDPSYYLREWDEHFNPEDMKNLRIVGGETTVADLMSERLLTVELEMPLPECAEKMLANHSHRLLVTNKDQLEGIITSFDLLRVVAAG